MGDEAALRRRLSSSTGKGSPRRRALHLVAAASSRRAIRADPFSNAESHTTREGPMHDLSSLEAYPALELIHRSHPRLVERLARVQEDARDFAHRYVAPIALEVDARVAREPTYFPWEIVRRGAERGYLTFNLPRMVGGGGQTTLATSILLEELCAQCAGIANIFGAHALGLAPLLVGGYDMQKYYRFLQETVRGEREGNPVLWAFAITEPGAGSDIEDADEVNHIE
ncbi:MAG TPA: hypothetical protein ENK17_02515, partial [Anaerolineae bacterium]|nr:hypothetical protein [Anaerolineae bacterium]